MFGKIDVEGGMGLLRVAAAKDHYEELEAAPQTAAVGRKETDGADLR